MPRIHKTLFVSLIAALLSITSSFAQTVTNPTFPSLSGFLWANSSVNAVGKTSFVSGSGLPYRYMLPKNFNANTKYAAIIYLHGSGEEGTDDNLQLAASNNTAHGALALISTANPDNETNYPCFFIAPQTTASIGWSSDTAATAIQNIINTFKTQYPNAFDTTRLYITGNSMGGFGTYDIPYLLAQSNHLGANPFAAMAPMSGGLDRDVSQEPKMPIWVFHGVEDTNVPINTSDDISVPDMRNAGWSVIYSRYATATHDMWELGYQHPLLMPWLCSQKLGAANAPFSNFNVTGATQTTGGSYATVSGTASTAEGYTGIGWTNTATNQTGTFTGTMTPTWSIANIPLALGTNPLELTAQAPNNIGTVFGSTTNYGGTTTVNLPYTVTPTASSASDIALNKPVTVSSTETTQTPGSAAVDGNNGTRWSSLYADPQWIVVDLGSSYNIREVDINWETACGKDYLVQTSPDNKTWTTQTTVTNNTTPGLHAYSYTSTPTGRYVRVYGTARATSWGYSIYEISVFGTVATAQSTSPTSTSLALNKTVTVSSVDATSHAGSMAVDSDLTTRWSSAYADNQWIEVDLGASHSISKITLNWETACGQNYLIQTSANGLNWVERTAVIGNSSAGLHTYTYATPITGRFVRVLGLTRATSWGFSLYDFSVYGQ